jgi:beta-galactosidase
METVTVPHDWAIYGPFDKMWINRVLPLFKMERIATEKTGEDGALPHIGTTWYRNKFTVPIDSRKKKFYF